MSQPLKIGVISDTHGYLDPKVLQIFQGVDHILHAGDIGSASLIFELESLAPVTAVLGNTDAGLNFRETEWVELSGRRFLVHHIVNVQAPQEALSLRPALGAPDVVVFGHSHKPHQETIAGTLFLNPGYAGKPRFNLPRSVAILQGVQAKLWVNFFPLA